MHTVEMIKAENLRQGYGKKIIIDSLDLTIGPGVTALVGPNGAGKTTLLRTLVTELSPKGGTVSIAGEPVTGKASIRRARTHIGFLPQNFTADPAFTVADLIRYAAWLRETDVSEQAVSKALAAVDLTDSARTKIRALSGGMRQRAAIACTIVGDPAILVFDEPTVGLDPAQRVYFREVLDQQRERTVLLSTHLIEDVVASADRVVVVDHGEVRFDGAPAALADLAPTTHTQGISRAELGFLTLLERK